MTPLLDFQQDTTVVDGLFTTQVDVEASIWEGGQIVAWQVIRAAVPASIALVETKVDHSVSPPVSASTYRISLDDRVLLDHRHRLRSAEGDLYRVDSYQPKGRNALLPEAEATRI